MFSDKRRPRQGIWGSDGVVHAGHTGVGGLAPGFIIRSGGGSSWDTVRLMTEVSDGKGPRKYNNVWGQKCLV